jgi:hypothetical protein
VAASKPKFPINEPDAFYKAFPHLTEANHKPTSHATPHPTRVDKPFVMYNCFAFAVNDRTKFWWPGGDGYWPHDPSDDTVEELVAVLKQHGYEPCPDGTHVPGVQKVAIFAKGGDPVHVAVQPSSRNGIWKSKMGYNIDMEHDLHAVETWDEDDTMSQGYGRAVVYLQLTKRPRGRR